jgi:hypothetical protein
MMSILRLLVLLTLLADAVVAQSDSSHEVDSSGPQERPAVVEQPLPIKYVRDSKGELVPVYEGIKYEEIMEVVENRLARAQREQPSQVQISQIDLRGQAATGFAQFEMTVKVSVRDDSPKKPDGGAWDWIQVPLNLTDASLLEDPVFHGQGEWRLIPKNGYEAWFRGDPSQDLSLQLKFACPLTVVANATHVKLNVPAAARSRLEFHIPGEQVSPSLQNALLLESNHRENETVVVATGLNDAVTLSWQTGVSTVAERPVRLDVQGDITVTVERPGSFTSQLMLDLKSFGDPIERFALRLPPDSTIVAGQQQDFEFTKASASSDTTSGRDNVFEIRLNRKDTHAQVQLRIETTGRTDQAINVAGIEVVEAFRQYGRVRLISPNDLRLRWTTSSNVTRTNDPQIDSQESGKRLVAAFDYFQQPSEINVSVEQQTTRIQVEPVYLMFIESSRISLTMVLKYRILGKPTTDLGIALGDWKYDSASPMTTIQDVTFDENLPFATTLKLNRETSGALDATISCHRTTAGREGPQEFELPRPRADSISPGFVLVAAADNVAISDLIQAADSEYVPDAVPADLRSEASRFNTLQPVRCFRIPGDPGPGKFKVDFRTRSQEIDLSLRYDIQLTDRVAEIRQQLNFDVRFERLTRITLLMPREIHDLFRDPATQDQVQITINDQKVDRPAISEAFTFTRGSNDVPLTVQLPAPTIGPISVAVRYDWKHRGLSGSADEVVNIPLVTSGDGELISNRLVITPQTGIRISSINNSRLSRVWRQESASSASLPLNGIQAETDERPTSIGVLAARLEDEAVPSASVATAGRVHRAWCQTWITAQKRRDRAVFRIQTAQARLKVKLPNAVPVDETDVLVDSQVIVPLVDAKDGFMVVPIADTGQPFHVVELSMRYADRPAVGTVMVEFPTLPELSDAGNWVWHLILPPTEHLLRASDQLTTSNAWTWSGRFLWRRPTMTQADLEEWTGATKQPSPEGANEYFFSSFTPMERTEFLTVARRSMVATGSGVALLVGVLLIYIPKLRHPATLLTLSVALATAAFIFPDPALLLAQASMFGILLAMVGQFIALILRRLNLDRPSVQLPVRREPASVVVAPAKDRASSAVTKIPFPVQPVGLMPQSDSNA